MKFIRRLLEKTPLVRFFKANDRVAAIRSTIRISRTDIRKARAIVGNLSVYGADKKYANFVVQLLEGVNEVLAKAEEI